MVIKDLTLEETEGWIAKTKLAIIQNSEDFEEYVETHPRDSNENNESIWSSRQAILFTQLDNLDKHKKNLIK